LTGTILFADDNVANLELLSGVLEVEGYQVRCVSDGGLVGIWEHYSRT
jgi:CheY-like chemotaxis protein